MIDRPLKLLVSDVRTVLDANEKCKKQQSPLAHTRIYTWLSNIRRSGVWLIRAPGYRALWLRFQSRSPYIPFSMCRCSCKKKKALLCGCGDTRRIYTLGPQDPRQLLIAWSSSHVYHGHLTQLAHTLPRKELITQIY